MSLILLKKKVEEGKMAEKMEIAKEMKNDGVPIEKISKYTGLSKDEIQNL